MPAGRNMLPPSAEGHVTRLAAARLAPGSLAPLLRLAGISPRTLQDPRARIAAGAQVRFLNLAAETLQDEVLGFRLAQSFEPRELGLFFYVQASAATLREALERGARYSALAHEGLKVRCGCSAGMTIRVDYVGVPRHTDRQQMEFLLTAILRTCRQLSGATISPTAVSMVHRRCAASSEIEAFLGTEIEFGAGVDSLTFADDLAVVPLVSADPFLHAVLVRYWEEALGQRPSHRDPIRAAVENAILPLLPHGKASLEVVAKSLHLSARTLSRRLADEGFTFGRLLHEMRADLAERYLDDPDLSVAEVAWLLGFREPSAFTHAYKRWTGINPRQRRRARVAV